MCPFPVSIGPQESRRDPQHTQLRVGVTTLMTASNANRILNEFGSISSNSFHQGGGFVDVSSFGPKISNRDAASEIVRPSMSEFKCSTAEPNGIQAMVLSIDSGDPFLNPGAFCPWPKERAPIVFLLAMRTDKDWTVLLACSTWSILHLGLQNLGIIIKDRMEGTIATGAEISRGSYLSSGVSLQPDLMRSVVFLGPARRRSRRFGVVI